MVRELWEEMAQSQFQPVGFEVRFGPGGVMPPVEIPGGAMPAQLRGFVDRLDLYEREGQTYVRVVDYKTGRKDFDYCDVLNGLGLQMLLYLFALEDSGRAYLGVSRRPQVFCTFRPGPRCCRWTACGIPGGPASAAEGGRRSGLLLLDEDVMQAMEADGESRFLPVKRSKSGTLTGDLATGPPAGAAEGVCISAPGRLVDGIAGGQVEPNPYSPGQSQCLPLLCICKRLPPGPVGSNPILPGGERGRILGASGTGGETPWLRH